MNVGWGLRVLLVTWLLLGAASGCSDDGDDADGGEHGEHDDGSAHNPMHPATVATTPPDELRDELLAMAAADQAERTGESPENGDAERVARLQDVIDEQGWPTVSLVGAEAASAAWLIAQHADHDVEFQEFALDLLRRAAADGEASQIDLAYLEDRVAVNRGQPQTYGTQMECVDGVAAARPLVNPATVDRSRAEVGLGPLADYLAEFDCSAEG